MSALARIPEFFPKVPYEQATWTSSERKVWDCLKWYEGSRGVNPGAPIEITDRMGSQWCSAKFGGSRYGSTGRRCWQKGLQRLEARGAIARTRAHGGRSIVTLIPFQGPKANLQPGAKPKGQEKPRKARPGPAPGPPSKPTTPEQLAAAAAEAEAVNEPAVDQPDDVMPGETPSQYLRRKMASAVPPPSEVPPEPRPAPTPRPRKSVNPALDKADPKTLAEILAQLEAKKAHPARE
jgi:hypothetical protein